MLHKKDGKIAENLFQYMNFIFQDWIYNWHDIKIRLILVFFRLSQILFRSNKFLRILYLPVFVMYRVIVVWVMNIELLPNLEVGRRLRIFHGFALVIHPSTVIGDDVTLRHCTTLGNKTKEGKGPRIGDRVNIGCNSVILGNISIGNDSQIGAGSVVINNVNPGDIVAGNPARVVKNKDSKMNIDGFC